MYNYFRELRVCLCEFATSSDVNNSNGCGVTVHFGLWTESKVPAGCEPLCVGRHGVSGGGGSFIPIKVMAIVRRFVYIQNLVNRVCLGELNNYFCTIFSVLQCTLQTKCLYMNL